MKERVLAIVNLIAQYIMDDDEMALNEQEIVEELLTVGFEAEEISAAFSWMENMSQEQAGRDNDFQPQTGIRIFTEEEKMAISSEGRGFLLRLQQLGILQPLQKEEIIDRLVYMSEEPADLEEVKTVTALTLFADTNQKWQQEIQSILGNDLTSIFH